MGVSAQRLERDLLALAAIGRVGETGVSRLTFTKEDMAARELVMGLMRQAGLEVRADAVGNILGRRPALLKEPVVASGSHIDTPLVGGRYDGVAGVLAAIEAARAMNDAGIITRYPIEVIAFTGEELSRFGIACKGSRAMIGRWTKEDLHKWRDAEGISFAEAMRAVGLDPDRLEEARRRPGEIKAYVELHIEQGKVLEQLGKPIGIPTCISAPTRLRITVEGVTDHSGATPMGLRHDALAGAAEMVLAVEKLCTAEAHQGTVGTVGVLTVEPGAANVIPGRAKMTVDIRGIDAASKRRAVDAVCQAVDEIARRRGLKVEIDKYTDEEPVPLGERVVSVIEAVCWGMGLDAHRMPSGAGHDAQHLTRITDVGMIFVPSVRGISHSPEEYTRLEDLARGTEVLRRTLLALAEVVEP